MLLKKLCYLKTNIYFMEQAWKRTPLLSPQSVGSRTLFYLISIMPKTFIEGSGNLKYPRNVKTINNTTVSHLVICCVIPRPGTMKGWEKETFGKIRVLGNLKCNKSNEYFNWTSITSDVQQQISKLFKRIKSNVSVLHTNVLSFKGISCSMCLIVY